MTIDELLIKYRDESISEREKGAKFERLMKNFLLTYPVYRGKFSDVWLWNEFPFREEFGGVDLSIDIVCKSDDDKFWAVQCKFYAETSIIDKPAVDTFLATKLLFLVPSISLLGQTLYEWATFAENPFNYICVCSDETASKKTNDEIKSVNLPLPATTDTNEIISCLKNFSENMTVVFSTYQSLDKVAAALHSYCLVFQCAARTLMHFAESEINLKQGSVLCVGLDNFEQVVK